MNAPQFAYLTMLNKVKHNVCIYAKNIGFFLRPGFNLPSSFIKIVPDLTNTDKIVNSLVKVKRAGVQISGRLFGLVQNGYCTGK